jgi:hypothetical protein
MRPDRLPAKRLLSSAPRQQRHSAHNPPHNGTNKPQPQAQAPSGPTFTFKASSTTKPVRFNNISILQNVTKAQVVERHELKAGKTIP